MNSKTLLLSIAVISVGLFAMPSTLSLFSGQHTFVDGSQVACQKCHSDIYNEIGGSLNQVHTSPNFTGSTGNGCQGCHRTGIVDQIPLGNNINATFIQNISTNANAHAAATLECVACHTAVAARISGSEEAHRPYYYASNYSLPGGGGNQTVIQLKGANTACIGCHTHVRVNLTWVRLTDYNVTATTTSGLWSVNISNDWPSSTNRTYTNKSY